jgi:hypothetical protein
MISVRYFLTIIPRSGATADFGKYPICPENYRLGNCNNSHE